MTARPAPLTNRERQSAHRQRARARGLCTQCRCRRARPDRRTCGPCCTEHAEAKVARHHRLREAALEAYGRRCGACPATSDLGIDHVDGRGAEHAAEHRIRNTFQLLRWLAQNNYPSGFQVLCRSCNASKGRRASIAPPAPMRRQATLFDGGGTS